MNAGGMLRWPATLISAGTPAADEYGDPEAGTPSSTVILCHAFPVTSTEDTVSAQVDSTVWTVWLRAGTVVANAIRVVLSDGPTLELTGPAMPFRNPRTGVTEYLTAPAKVVV